MGDQPVDFFSRKRSGYPYSVNFACLGEDVKQAIFLLCVENLLSVESNETVELL